MNEAQPITTLPAGYRRVRRTECPRISVVVVSAGEAAGVRACLGELLPECQRRGVELVLVCGAAQPPGWNDERAQGARVLWAGSVAEGDLRVAGMAAAEGDIVVLAGEHAAATPGWLSERLAGWPHLEALPEATSAARAPRTRSRARHGAAPHSASGTRKTDRS